MKPDITNKAIKDLLRQSTEPMSSCILTRIEELEAENATLIKSWKETCEACYLLARIGELEAENSALSESWKEICEGCGFNNADGVKGGCAHPDCTAHKWRLKWWTQSKYGDVSRQVDR